MVPEGYERLDPRYVDVRQMAGMISAAVWSSLVLIALATLVFAADMAWLKAGAAGVLWLVGFAALVWWRRRWPVIAYAHACYRIDEAGIEIRKGVVWRSIVNVPRSRVQHTDVSQGPIERRFGLSTLIIHTAGTEHAQVALTGLARPVAITLRDQLLPRDGRDAV